MALIRTTRWSEIDAIFDEALMRPENERSAFVRARCGDDRELHDAVITLLRADEKGGRILGEHAADFVPHLVADSDAAEGLSVGDRVGPYEVDEELGRGGMGVVYRAHRVDGTFDKTVALKVVKRGMDTDEILQRFRFERRVLAGLDHPGIARILDAGATADGRPFLVMEHVSGKPLTTFAAERGLDLRSRLVLFRKACEAVGYAHRALVVHRDLKPSNVLAASSEAGEPVVKLLDFGIAKLLSPTADEPETRTGVYPMTPEYAAPEQRAGQSSTAATDVYALGVILSELLTGSRPGGEGSTSIRDAARSLATDRRISVPDLEVLVATATHVDPDRRFETVAELEDDVEALLHGMPLSARPDSVAYRFGRFVSRHRGAVASAAVAMLLLGAAATYGFVQQRRTVRAEQEALATASFMGSLFHVSDPAGPERRDTLRVRDLLRRGADRAHREFAERPAMRSQLLHAIGETYLELGLYPEADSVLGEAVAARRPHGPGEPLATSLVAHAAARRETGHGEESAALAREAAGIARSASLGDVLIRAERELALALAETAPAEAERVIRASIDRMADENGVAHSHAIAEAQQVLGRTLGNQMRVDEAIAVYESAVARLDSLHGAESVYAMSPLRELSFMLLMAGRTDEAAEVVQDAVAVTRRSRPGSGSLAAILSVQGSILTRTGRLDEAEEALREAVTLPPRRPTDRAVSLGSLATVLRLKGALREAITLQREALGILENEYGSDNQTTAYSMLKLGEFLAEAREFAEAEEKLLRVYELLAAQNGRHGAGGARPAGSLSRLYEAWGRPREAARWAAIASADRSG